MEDPEPALFVPVHHSRLGTVTPVTARIGIARRAGIAFTSLEALTSAMEPGQDWIRLAHCALAGMLDEIGIDTIEIDPMRVISRPLIARAAWTPLPIGAAVAS